ncbi:MAPEG family protein [Litoreibacter roseus]|uniref:Membrane protein n=1 Tax=Litoreibacter roseus TaxID=2601869 RepID=A0A6N6JIF4_9RHOB|nr:MAPEG family protein [Litoreibacter roseus]GFE65894.1 membrane protein [Litoreibacter roseus]
MADFPTELGILVCLALLAASLWIPYIIGVNTEPEREGAADPFVRPLAQSEMRPWVHRAYRAHLNLLEQFLPFAVVILVLDRVGGFNTITYWTAIIFFWLRVAHAAGMITGWATFPVRPLLFIAGWMCILVLGWQVFASI